MKRPYWEKMASVYDEEIFDVLKQDKKGLIIKAIKKHANANATAIDIGCAIGKWLPTLSPLFNKVVALDISAENLRIAKEKYAHLENISYLRADMSSKGVKLPKSDLGICINAILTPTKKDRQHFFSALTKCIKKNGILIASVPAFESKLLTHLIQREFNIDKREFADMNSKKHAPRRWNNILQGNFEIDNVPHKHFTREELQLLFNKAGFEVLQLEKIEYPWSTEFNNPPKWLKDPKPWDWMIVLKKK